MIYHFIPIVLKNLMDQRDSCFRGSDLYPQKLNPNQYKKLDYFLNYFLIQPCVNIFLRQRFVCLILSFHSFYSFANTDKTSAQPNAFEQFVPFLLIGVFFYFILIRPQQKKYKQHGNFLSKIKRGDEVLTSSGIYGKIEGLTDSFVILEVAENVRIRIAKSQIASYTEDNTKQGQNKTNKKTT